MGGRRAAEAGVAFTNLPCLFVPNELSDALRPPPDIECSCHDAQLDLFEGDDVAF